MKPIEICNNFIFISKLVFIIENCFRMLWRFFYLSEKQKLNNSRQHSLTRWEKNLIKHLNYHPIKFMSNVFNYHFHLYLRSNKNFLGTIFVKNSTETVTFNYAVVSRSGETGWNIRYTYNKTNLLELFNMERFQSRFAYFKKRSAFNICIWVRKVIKECLFHK